MPIPAHLLTHISGIMEQINQYFTADFSKLDTEAKRKKVAEVCKMCSIAASAVAPMPIPFADIWTITPIQMAMVRAIGNIYGYKVDGETLKEMMAVIGGGILGQQACLAAFKIGLPGAGGFGGAFFVYIWTNGMGWAAQKYFESDMKASKKELAEARKQGAQAAKDDPEAKQAKEKETE